MASNPLLTDSSFLSHVSENKNIIDPDHQFMLSHGYRQVYTPAAIRSSAPNPMSVAEGAILYYTTALDNFYHMWCEYGSEGNGRIVQGL